MELEALSREKDPELFFAGLLNLGNRLVAAEKWEAAIQVFGVLRDSESAVPPKIKPIAAPYGEKASRQWDVIQGKGAVGPRSEFLLRTFSSQALDLGGILGMGLAGVAFKLARFSLLKGLLNSKVSNILTRGVGARGLANLAGVFSEASVLSLSTQAAQVFSGQKGDHGPGQFGNQFLQNGLTLAALRVAGWGSGKLMAQATSPRLFHSLGGLITQGSMLGGILLAKKAGEKFQLTETSPAQTSVLDDLVTLLHFNVGARLNSQLFGKNLGHWEKTLDIQTGVLLKHGEGRPLLGFQRAFAPAVGPNATKGAGTNHAPTFPQVSLMAGKSGKGGITPSMETIIKSLRRPDDYPLNILPDFIKNNPYEECLKLFKILSQNLGSPNKTVSESAAAYFLDMIPDIQPKHLAEISPKVYQTVSVKLNHRDPAELRQAFFVEILGKIFPHLSPHYHDRVLKHVEVELHGLKEDPLLFDSGELVERIIQFFADVTPHIPAHYRCRPTLLGWEAIRRDTFEREWTPKQVNEELEKFIPPLDSEQRKFLAIKVISEPALQNDLRFGALVFFLPHLDAADRLDFVLQAWYGLNDEYHRESYIPELPINNLKNIIPHLNKEDKTKWALEILENIKDGWGTSRNRFGLAALADHLDKADRETIEPFLDAFYKKKGK